MEIEGDIVWKGVGMDMVCIFMGVKDAYMMIVIYEHVSPWSEEIIMGFMYCYILYRIVYFVR